jgi:pimeloyl-ACP methyl ester carboxylesterase
VRPSHWLDTAYAQLASLRPLFEGGWGDEGLLATASRDAFFGRPPDAAVPRFGPPKRERGVWVRDGTFPSPEPRLVGPVAIAHVRWLTASLTPGHSCCLVLAGSREEGFALREAVHRPNVHRGVDLVLLENPFSGLRRAEGQRTAAVRTVSEHLLLNRAMLQEARALLGFLGHAGYSRRGVAGYSMGGFMAALVAALSREPLAVAALAAGTTPAPVFTEGLLSRSVDFVALGQGRGQAWARQRLAFLFGLADARQLPPPVQPEAAVVVGCRRDGYVSLEDTQALHAHWPGSTLRWLDAGHVSAPLLHRAALREATASALGRLG